VSEKAYRRFLLRGVSLMAMHVAWRADREAAQREAYRG